MADLVSAARASVRVELLAWNHILNGSHLDSETNFGSRENKVSDSDYRINKCDLVFMWEERKAKQAKRKTKQSIKHLILASVNVIF